MASGKAVYRDVVCAKALALSAVGGNNSEPLFEESRDRYAHAKRSIPPCHDGRQPEIARDLTPIAEVLVEHLSQVSVVANAGPRHLSRSNSSLRSVI